MINDNYTDFRRTFQYPFASDICAVYADRIGLSDLRIYNRN